MSGTHPSAEQASEQRSRSPPRKFESSSSTCDARVSCEPNIQNEKPATRYRTAVLFAASCSAVGPLAESTATGDAISALFGETSAAERRRASCAAACGGAPGPHAHALSPSRYECIWKRFQEPQTQFHKPLLSYVALSKSGTLSIVHTTLNRKNKAFIHEYIALGASSSSESSSLPQSHAHCLLLVPYGTHSEFHNVIFAWETAAGATCTRAGQSGQSGQPAPPSHTARNELFRLPPTS